MVEPMVSQSKSYSMLTYLSHLEVGKETSSGAQQQFEEEVTLKQPLSITFLREYLQIPAIPSSFS